MGLWDFLDSNRRRAKRSRTRDGLRDINWASLNSTPARSEAQLRAASNESSSIPACCRECNVRFSINRQYGCIRAFLDNAPYMHIWAPCPECNTEIISFLVTDLQRGLELGLPITVTRKRPSQVVRDVHAQTAASSGSEEVSLLLYWDILEAARNQVR